MKKILLYLFSLSILLVQVNVLQAKMSSPEVLNPGDTIAKINFSWDNTWDVDDWVGVYGSASLPIDLGSGITLSTSGGELAMGTSGEPSSTVVPDKVSNTYNWMSNTDDTPIDLIFTGLDPEKEYDFMIYASRDDATAEGNRTTTFTASGTSISGSINPVGNASQLITLYKVAPVSSGAIVIQMTKLAGNYGYINGLIIREATDANIYDLTMTTVGNGLVSPSSGSYEEGTSVTLTATPDEEWQFEGWSGDVAGTETSATITMDADKNVTATFKKIVLAVDTLSKINFSSNDGDWDVEGWVNIYGSESSPVDLGDGMTMTLSGGSLFMGSSGEPASSAVPDKVSNTYNWMSNTDETPVNIVISGLDTSKIHYFDIYASRDAESAFDERVTTYTVSGTSISGSVNAVGNDSALVNLSGVTPTSPGTVTIQITKQAGNYGYINALIITQEATLYDFMVNINGNGSVYPSSDVFREGETIEVIATADPGWVFSGWSGDVTEKVEAISVVMDTDKSITANFNEGDAVTIESTATAEAGSKDPDEVDLNPADLMVRASAEDSATYEAFVKFDISQVETDNLISAAIVTAAGQHNPSGESEIDPYWIDIYGCNTTDWADPFTWNNTRDMHKGDLLASENVLGFGYNYIFGSKAIADWIKAKKQEGATEVVFRYNAREELPWDVWLSGTWQGEELVLVYAISPDSLHSIATNEVNSKNPDEVDQNDADLMVQITAQDTANYEAFVKFDISDVQIENLTGAKVVTYGGQHNPSGETEIDPYWIDMYGCNTVDWPEQFTWNNTRDMHKGDLLASENILGFDGNYTFGGDEGDEVIDWIIAKKQEGATEVVFRYQARDLQSWDIWLSGTWKGQDLLLEYRTTSIDENKITESSIILYPNPVQNELTLTNIGFRSVISVYNISGKKLLETQNEDNNEVRLSMTRFKAGIYIIRVVSETSKAESFKVIKW